MTDENLATLRALLHAYADRAAKEPPPAKGQSGEEAQRRACGDRLRTVVRPLLDAFMGELRNSGHDASTRDQTDRENAYPSVALSFTPKPPAAATPRFSLASALIFRYDPRHGDVKHAPTARRATPATGERLGTIGVEALSAEWVETKTLNFIDAVLKAN
jgi:hypothetical protein